ncbi:hypothetical protein GOC74_07570 [Halomicrobium mukohataei]|uniref:Uncharacterized protein n=1 Tax=Halomicrobium mukohataei TaxID=57705 RepID=A0A847UC41_9EURY|nr:hypothetical protein [Halomicrobium mukohataei]NLV09787.1 hypothetical protein [Halomicrobium mukohataei]
MDTQNGSPTVSLEAVDEKVSRVLAASRVVQTSQSLTAQVAKVTRASSLYRWLTKEPDPEVVVVDLRETHTVGPFVRLLDRLVPHVERAWNGSSLKRATARTGALVRDAPVKVASVLLLVFLSVQTLQSLPAIQSGSVTTVGTFTLAWLLALVGLRVDWTLAELAESRAGRLLRALLEPPEPPNED